MPHSAPALGRRSSPVARGLSRRTSARGLGAQAAGAEHGHLPDRVAAQQGAAPTGGDEAPPFLDAWLALWTGGPHGIEAVYADAAVWEDVAAGVTAQGHDQIRATIRAGNEEELAAFPDRQREVRSAFAAGKRAAVEIVFTGTYTGTLPGLPPGAGQPVAMRGVAIFELDGQKIRRESHYYDPASLPAQLGLEPPGREGPSAA